MKKKILIGVIISIIILVGVSFTSVVGYRSEESNIRISPLFNIRTNGAIDVTSKDLTYDYIGKGDETTIYLLSRLKKEELIDRISIIFNNIDDKSYDRFVELIIKYFYMKFNIHDINKDKITHSLNQLRDNRDYKIEVDEGKSDPTILKSVCNNWEPGCLFWRLLIEILNFYDCILYNILEVFLGVTFAYCDEHITLK